MKHKYWIALAALGVVTCMGFYLWAADSTASWTGTTEGKGTLVFSLLGITSADINGGTLDGVTVGGASACTATLTRVIVNTSLKVNSAVGTVIIGAVASTVDILSGATSATVTLSGFDTGDVVILTPEESLSTATVHVQKEAGAFDIILTDATNGNVGYAASDYTIGYLVIMK